MATDCLQYCLVYCSYPAPLSTPAKEIIGSSKLRSEVHPVFPQRQNRRRPLEGKDGISRYSGQFAANRSTGRERKAPDVGQFATRFHGTGEMIVDIARGEVAAATFTSGHGIRPEHPLTSQGQAGCSGRGVHTGNAVMGNIGDQHLTVIRDHDTVRTEIEAGDRFHRSRKISRSNRCIVRRQEL